MCNCENNNSNGPYPCMYQYCPYAAAQFQCPYRAFYWQGYEDYQRLPQGAPTAPPPNFTPQLASTSGQSLKAVDPGAIKPCVYTFSYIWLRNGQSFWAYLIYVGKTSASGWRYRNGRWQYFGIDLKEIKSFTCY